MYIYVTLGIMASDLECGGIDAGATEKTCFAGSNKETATKVRCIETSFLHPLFYCTLHIISETTRNVSAK